MIYAIRVSEGHAALVQENWDGTSTVVEECVFPLYTLGFYLWVLQIVSVYSAA